MLSILIPTYNYDILPLVKSIKNQAVKANILFEIICIDDGSSSILNKKNKKMNTLSNCSFKVNKFNQGLSINRNTLAEASKYKYLLFIDGDSVLIHDNFINNYLNAIPKGYDVIYGGRIHPKNAIPQRKLRWKYGKSHEDKNYLDRRKNKYKSVLFNNTIIKKEVFNKVYFETNITEYGHEDTIFAYKLSKIKASIYHIDNTVLHGDVDLNKVFFSKMHKSLNNLDKVYKNKLVDPNFITFLKIFNKLKFWKLNYLLAYSHIILYPIYKRQLISNYPSLFLFNLFRLSYFCNINLKK
ncbi:glycosyltransferase [Sabulilitoribacter arenilitoris]|uniref:Glycosyltransferase n=1 Tax=Wocania arenilitoris TaxID=2044858 RepID=A0AAE3JQS9_9FLAO|nr:glycosyltransferase family 2 protein [Wocania arenilitoris]MCF7569500.1 glycosyltransferase [Wocania arenilitoris]